MEVQKDKGRKVEHKVVPFTTGYAQLPWRGGMEDQPLWTMSMFDQFMAGERAAAYKQLSK